MFKSTVFQYFLLITFFIAVVSCQDDPSISEAGSGKVQLSFSEALVEGGRLQQGSLSILLSIKNADGLAVYEKKQLNLFKFGEEYLSEPIALSTGNFQLTEFIVLNEDNEAIYATPLAGSKLAYLVENSLPFDFTIAKDVTVKVVPDVIDCTNHSPADFGYNTFSFNVVKTFPFLVGVLAYDPNTKNFELTSAHLLVTMDDDTLFTQALEAKTNEVKVTDKADLYKVTVTKENYIPFVKSFTAAELKGYWQSPLVVTLLNNSISEGLIAHYPFTGNALDSTSNNYDGIVHEAILTTDRHGNNNASYYFDGQNDYISVPHAAALNLSGDFTISLWAEIAATQVPHEGINDILRKWNGTAEGYPFAIAYLNPLADDAYEDKIIHVRYDGQGCANAPTSYSPAIENDVFQHIVLVKQGNTLRQYLNNVLIQEFVDNTTCSTANTADMTIGCRGNLVRFFKGKIDDIRIYGRAISNGEITNLYNE
jgi:hypothetical protein